MPFVLLVHAAEHLGIDLARRQKNFFHAVLLDQALHQIQVLRVQKLPGGADDKHGMTFVQFVKCAFLARNNRVVHAGGVHHLQIFQCFQRQIDRHAFGERGEFALCAHVVAQLAEQSLDTI